MSIETYYPEMGHAKPAAQGECTITHDCKYRLVTPLELAGRGIRKQMTYAPDDLTERGQYKVGWHVYYVTYRAMDALKGRYTFAKAVLL